MRRTILMLPTVLAFTGLLFAQQPLQTPETSSEVPALTNFHSVIYPLWHDAWPNKDAKKLGELLPDVESGVKEIAAAELPGILRERKDAWEKEVKALQAIAAEYRSAAEHQQTQPLLDAAEKLHMQYEKLVRILRPSLKEMGEFHAALYVLYHYYMPGDSVERMQQSAVTLKEKMTTLNAAILPERLKAKEDMFNATRKNLALAVDALATLAPKGDVKEMRGAVEKVHAEYQKLDDLLVK